MRDVLRYAGGTSVLANPNRAQLERIDPTQPRRPASSRTSSSTPAGLHKQLRDGDVLTLLPISPQFANAVTLQAAMSPSRCAIPYTPGMRIRDLIPDREALITPDFYRRKNLLVQVIDRRDAARQRATASARSLDRADDAMAAAGSDGRTHATPRRHGAIGRRRHAATAATRLDTTARAANATPATRNERAQRERRPGGGSARARRPRRCSTS